MSSEFFESWLLALLVRGIVLGGLCACFGLLLRKVSADRMSVWWRCGVLTLLIVAFIPWSAVRWWIPVEREAPVFNAMGVQSPTTYERDLTVAQRPTPDIEHPTSNDVVTTPMLDQTGSELPTEPAKPSLGWWVWIWTFGAAVILFRLFASLYRVGTIIRKAVPITDSRMIDVLNAACREVGIRRSIVIRSHPEIDSPFAAGFFQPVIILPGGAERLDENALRLMLRHELAHIVRFDVPWQIAAEVAVAFHWVNPVVWMMRRRLRIAHEAAADDVVLNGGVAGPDYASVLFGMACNKDRFSGSPCLAPMARVSTLRKRIGLILDARRRRDATRPAIRWALAGCACGMALVLGLTGLRAQVAPPAPLSDQSWSRSYRDTFILENSFGERFRGTNVEALAAFKKELAAAGVRLDDSIKLELAVDKTALNVEFSEFDRTVVERQLARFMERAGWWRDASERQKAAVETAMWAELEVQRKRMEEAGKRMTAARVAGNIVDREPDNPKSTISITYPAASASIPETKPSETLPDIANVPFTLTAHTFSQGPTASFSLELSRVNGGILVSVGTATVKFSGAKVDAEKEKARREADGRNTSEYFTAKGLYLHEKKVYEELKRKNQ